VQLGGYLAGYRSFDLNGNESLVLDVVAGVPASAFVSGLVESVDRRTGSAVVDGFVVDYTGISANGFAPTVGDYLDVSGFGLQSGLVAQPLSVSTDLIR
ncbi:MAG: hypothetical protein AB8F65_03745, partial [Woeseiaceae bacterium]